MNDKEKLKQYSIEANDFSFFKCSCGLKISTDSLIHMDDKFMEYVCPLCGIVRYNY